MKPHAFGRDDVILLVLRSCAAVVEMTCLAMKLRGSDQDDGLDVVR
jgi:hypothetical protein